jgi:hypothetical protein
LENGFHRRPWNGRRVLEFDFALGFAADKEATGLFLFSFDFGMGTLGGL